MKLNIEITTDGSIHPKDALKEAAAILIQHFWLFSMRRLHRRPRWNRRANNLMRNRCVCVIFFSPSSLIWNSQLGTKLPESCKYRDICRFGCHQRTDLMKFRNFGKKSLNEIDMLMDRLKLNFGMDITKYNIEIKAQENEAQ